MMAASVDSASAQRPVHLANLPKLPTLRAKTTSSRCTSPRRRQTDRWIGVCGCRMAVGADRGSRAKDRFDWSGCCIESQVTYFTELTMTQLSLTAVLDRTSYPPAEDSLAYCLAKLRLGTEESSPATSPESEGPGVNLALVLDVSGSMDKPNRFPLLCDAVRRLVIGLRPGLGERHPVHGPFRDRDPVHACGGSCVGPRPDYPEYEGFGLTLWPRTNLAPGLRLAIEGFQSRAISGGRAPPDVRPDRRRIARYA